MLLRDEVRERIGQAERENCGGQEQGCGRGSSFAATGYPEGVSDDRGGAERRDRRDYRTNDAETNALGV